MTLVAVFVGSRIALLSTPLKQNLNWEEPVFLFSAGELARDGLTNLFDYQDDLNHGGSLLLILIGVPWQAFTGDDLRMFKGIAILWSTLTLLAHMAVGWRYFAPSVGLLWGTFFVGLSGVSARLNVTLIGSHPEALLPAATAIAAYLELLRRPTRPPWLQALFGFLSALSLWVAYTSVILIAPLGLVWLTTRPDRRDWLALAGGALVGWSPWVYQNAILRPHGLLALVPKLRGFSVEEEVKPWMWNGLLASFESGVVRTPEPQEWWGAVVLVVTALLLLGLTVRVALGRDPEWRKVAPFLVAPVVGLAALIAASPPFYPWDHFANYRFFAPIHAAIYWILAIGIVTLSRSATTVVATVVSVAVLGHALWTHGPLYAGAGGPSEQKFPARLAGCRVFAMAEVRRAPNFESGIDRLSEIPNRWCRNKAIAQFRKTFARVFPDR